MTLELQGWSVTCVQAGCVSILSAGPWVVSKTGGTDVFHCVLTQHKDGSNVDNRLIFTKFLLGISKVFPLFLSFLDRTINFLPFDSSLFLLFLFAVCMFVCVFCICTWKLKADTGCPPLSLPTLCFGTVTLMELVLKLYK